MAKDTGHARSQGRSKGASGAMEGKRNEDVCVSREVSKSPESKETCREEDATVGSE